MEKETVESKLNFIPEIKTALAELKALFTSEKKGESPTEVTAEVPVITEPVAEPAKVEFNAEAAITEFKASITEALKSHEDKFSAFDAQIKTANDAITKQDETLKKFFSLVEMLTEKVNSVPTGMARQVKKEGSKSPAVDHLSKESLEAFRNLK